jgi:hemolysin activation/secretion protein
MDYSGKAGEKRPEFLDDRKEAAPQSPMLLPPVPSPAREGTGQILKGVFARKITVTGSTVFTPEELAKTVAPYENRQVTMEDLESLRRDLTLLYVNRGYINSGAVLPDQTVKDGQITIKVVEGQLTDIRIQGTKWFSDSFLKDRIALGVGVPVNIAPLQERLQLLQQDQRIQRLHAEMRPGARPGEAELQVKVEEKPPISAWFAFNNYQSPSIGAERGIMTLTHQNLTGRGDILSFTYGYSDGLDTMIDTWYAVPLNAYDTTLMFRYRKDDSTVVDNVFGPLDIVSKTESFELSLRQPVMRTLTQEIALSLSIEHERNTTSLLNEPFSFSPGVENGKSVVVPLRFSQEWTYRTQKQVIAARSRMTFGLDTWNATVHSDSKGPDGRFFAWLGQFQWARILDFLDTQLIARADLQKSTDSLLPIEQMGIGGRYTVRGYRENQLVRDEAFIASLEARVPVVQNERWADYVQIAPFIDYGRGNSVDMPTTGPEEISSIGAGLRWGGSLIKAPFDLKADAEFYWGYRLRGISHSHEDLQDNGIHFQVAVTALF